LIFSAGELKSFVVEKLRLGSLSSKGDKE